MGETNVEHDKVDASIFNYATPAWFFDNIKTVSELKDVKTKILLTDEAETEGRETCKDEEQSLGDNSTEPIYRNHENCFVLSSDAFEELLDATASLQVQDSIDKQPSRKCSVVIYSKMRHGLHFLDELAVLTAQQLHCSLISVHPYELADIAEAFLDQDQTAMKNGHLEATKIADKVPESIPNTRESLEYYFAARAERKADDADTKRGRAAVFSLLDAAKVKSQRIQQKESTTNTDAKQTSLPSDSGAHSIPVILYLRDGLRFFEFSSKLGRRVLCRVRDAINERRRAGENIVLIIGVTHTTAEEESGKPDLDKPWKFVECKCPVCICPELSTCSARSCDMSVFAHRLEATELLSKTMIPLSVPEGWQEEKKVEPRDCIPNALVRSWKRRLLSQVSRYPSCPPNLLDPDCDWLELLPEIRTNQLFVKTYWDEKKDATLDRIIGRCNRRKRVDIGDIRSILLQAIARKEAEAKKDTAESNIADSEKVWKKKLDDIKQTTSSAEDSLLPCLIDPATLTTGFDDVIMNQDVLASIKTLLHLFKLKLEATSKTLMSQIKITGALLYGSPGTGKTHLARAIAKDTGSNMIIITPGIINSKWVGESEKIVQATFSLASKLFPCVVFIDEVDALFYRRKSDDTNYQRATITEFLQAMDGLGQNPRAPFVLAATNRPMDLDSAFLRRLPHKVHVDLPDYAARASILQLFLKEDDLDGVQIDQLAAMTKDFSGSDLKNLCGQAGLAWAVEQNLTPLSEKTALKVQLTNKHFTKAFDEIQPSVSHEDMTLLKDFTRRFGPSVQTLSSEKPNVSSEKFAQATKEKHSPIPVEIFMPIVNPPDGCLDKERISYCYTALPTTTSIRLLKVYTLREQVLEHMYDPLQCSIVVTDLTTKPDYFALSYTWGDPRTHYLKRADMIPSEAWAAPAFEIECDGLPVSIATNLYTALVSIRAGFCQGHYATTLGEEYQSQEIGSFYLWVDALCINQNDIDEKNCQVPLMDRIYSQARATLMWLGGGELWASRGWFTTTRRLLLVIDRISKSLGSERSEELLKELRAFDIFNPKAYTDLGLEAIQLVDLSGWYYLITRSWFSRAWVVQEWLLSPKSAFISGSTTIQSEYFIAMLLEFGKNGWLWRVQDMVEGNTVSFDTFDMPTWNQNMISPPQAYGRSARGTWNGVPILFRKKSDGATSVDFTDAFKTGAMTKTLLDPGELIKCTGGMEKMMRNSLRAFPLQLILYLRVLRVTDPRDKIYSLRSLIKDRSGRLIFAAPDYAKDVRDVYIDAAHALAAAAGISILCLREPRLNNPHNLPSWVPDFETNWNKSLFDAVPRVYMAASGLGVPAVEHKPGNVLGVKGCRIDTVVHVRQPDSKQSLMDTMNHIPKESVIKVSSGMMHYDRCEACANPGPFEEKRQDRLEVLWRTCILDQYDNEHPAPAHCGTTYMRRLEEQLRRQYRSVVHHDVRILLEKLDQEAQDATRNDPFFTRVQVEGLDLLATVQSVLRKEYSWRSDKTAPYDRRSAITFMFETYTTIWQLKGESLSCGAVPAEPPFWDHHQILWQAILARCDKREFLLFHEALLTLLDHANGATTDQLAEDRFYCDVYSRQCDLFATSGRRLGVGLRPLEACDEIWILAGLCVPVALRSLGGRRYTMVSCVYVHGIMHGEGLSDASEIVNIDLV